MQIGTKLSSVDPDLEAKKALLQREIVDKNYNREQFIDYCTSRSNYGDDLTKWPMNELQTVINDFVRAHQEEEVKQKQTTQDIRLDIQKMEHNLKNTLYSSTKEIVCKRLEKSELNDKNVNVFVRNPKAIETGLLSTNYITYEVFTDITNWLVRRRYSDFIWLRATLVKFFPRIFVPPMPNKKLGSRRFEADFIEKRMGFLDRFLKGVVKNETFKASEPLLAFLSMSDRSQFESKMKELTSFTPSQYIEDIKTLSGKLKLLEDDGNDGYYKNVTNYFKLQSQLFERMSYNLKNFYCNISASCSNLEEVQKDFETLSLLNEKVLMKEEIKRTFDEFGIFFKNWSRILYKQNELVKTNVREFFKYSNMEGNAFQDLIISRDALKARYLSEHLALCKKKDKLWASMDVTKWEIVDEFEKVDRLLLFRDKNYACAKMCTRETQIVENLHKQLDYANNMNNEELKRLIDENCKKYLDNAKEFTDQFYPTLNDFIAVWSQLSSYTDNRGN